MDSTFAKDVLFPVIRRGMNFSDARLELSADDCDRLLQVGERQSILPIIWNGVKDLYLPDGWIERFKDGCTGDIYSFVARDYAIESIIGLFEEAHVPYVLLKGSVIRDLYPEKWLRTCCDVDILIREEDVDRAVALLEQKTDLRVEKRNYHDISMMNSQIHLELHFSIKENMDNIDGLLSRVWDYALPTESSLYVLTPEYQLFHTVAHMSYHIAHGGIGVRAFLDLWLLLNKTSYNKDILADMCRTSGIHQFYETCCEITEVWMDGKDHTEVTSALEAYCLHGGVFGSAESNEVAKQRKHKGITYLLSRVFVSGKVLREVHPELRRKPHLIVLYQIKRWFGLFKKEKRQRVISAVRQAQSADKDKIDSFDKLLTSIGL